MSLSTFKTTIGFLKSLVRKYTPLDASANSLDDIYNYLPITERISTSGQPTEKQFAIIKAHGFNRVINLAPHNAENSIPDEEGTLNQLGIEYIHIPVDFSHPSDEDFNQFKSAMLMSEKEKVWVHCAANMRVSAFVYRYRCGVLGEQESEAKEALDKIWKPYGVWKRFIDIR